MSVHRYAGCPIGIRQKKRSRLPSHARQLQHLVQRIRHLSSVFLPDLLTAFFHVSCLVLIQADGTDIAFDLFDIRLRHILRRMKSPEQPRKRLIHLLIRALGAQHDRHQKLPVLIVIEAFLLGSVQLVKTCENVVSFFLFCHWCSSFSRIFSSVSFTACSCSFSRKGNPSTLSAA